MAQKRGGDTAAVFGGLGDAELDAAERVLSELGGTIGFDAKAAFSAMRSGASMTDALGLPERTADAVYAQAITHFNSGNVAAAMPLFQALTFLAPDVRDHWLGLGICARVHEGWDVARLSFLTASSLAPETSAPAFHLCELYCQQKDWANARAELQRFDASEAKPEKQRLEPEIKRLRSLIQLHS